MSLINNILRYKTITKVAYNGQYLKDTVYFHRKFKIAKFHDMNIQVYIFRVRNYPGAPTCGNSYSDLLVPWNIMLVPFIKSHVFCHDVDNYLLIPIF